MQATDGQAPAALDSAHWYAILSSRELGARPLARRRFGEDLVFWRAPDGRPAGLVDRCPHRGAALSLGAVRGDCIACPYHGFEFDPDGRCRRVPAEGPDWAIPPQFRAQPLSLAESQGFVWLWRGPPVDTKRLPRPPRQPGVDGLARDECVQQWPAHYTRCIEGVLDHSHLPFVHRKTLGRAIRDPVTRVEVERRPGGFRAMLMQAGRVRHHVDFTAPNIWTQMLTPGYGMSATFAPVDDTQTTVYCRLHRRVDVPLLRPLTRLWCRFSNWLVFHEDQAVLASQRPRSADDASGERLLPSDAAVIEFRRLRAAQHKSLHGGSRRPQSRTSVCPD